MKRYGLALVIVCALVIGGMPGARTLTAAAQTGWPPTIFLFTSDVENVTIPELESGDVEATFRWHIAHVRPGDQITLHAYQGSEWVPLGEPGTVFEPVDELALTLEHPRNFGPPTYRLSVVDTAGRLVEQRILVIPYDKATDTLAPSIFSFSALDQTVPAADLAAGTARVRVSWVVRDRPPRTHIMFEQIIGDDTVNVELPRAQLYVPSQGSGVVAPVAPDGSADTSTITLQLTVIDVISADVIDQKQATVTVMGTALPPETSTAPPEPTEEPAPDFGALTVLENCTLYPPGVPERGWIDSSGIPSPNGRLMAYITNAVEDAELVIAQADGTGQVTVAAPDENLPLWSRPRWSPDGLRIAFNNITMAAPGGGTIYAVTIDGTDLRELATYTGYYDDIAWSADGSQIFFTSGDTSGDGSTTVGNYQIYAVSTDGLGTAQPVAPGCGVIE